MAYTTIDNPFKYCNTVLYTGNATARTITTGLETTDWIWNKRRDNSGSHLLYDKVRGVNKDLNTDSTEAEETQVGTVTAFGTDNFTLGTHGGTNANGETKANWCWSAGGTTGSSNSDGSITSTVSANTTAGFSIVSYTGTGSNATVGHGIDTPRMYIVKRRSNTGNWYTYHESIGNTKRLRLDETAAATTESAAWNNTSPTSSVFSLGTSVDVNASGETYIAYCFAEKKGYSKFDSYTGNGNANGPFIYTGFKPAFVMIKQSSAAGNSWNIYDNKRNTFNVMDKFLLANSNQAESSYSVIDFVSNGIKLRNTASSFNTSSSTYIYMAFAEAPFVTSGTKAPGTAR